MNDSIHSINDSSPSGKYIVNNDSFLIVIRYEDTNFEINENELKDSFDFMFQLPPVPNPLRPSTFLKRPQVTFAPIDYNFGQKTKTLPMDENTPIIVHKCKTICENVLKQYGYNASYNGAHLSLYPNGEAGLLPHEDNEPVIDQNVPIASISFGETRKLAFYRHQTKEEREIQISKSRAKKTPDPKPVEISSLKVRHGDIIIMVNMQNIGILHGVVKEPKLNNSRLNLTFRNFLVDGPI
tara:strand:- start:1650 stop:2366 length:717 start_codon:yes stop_codon:yes gene_type:complete